MWNFPHFFFFFDGFPKGSVPLTFVSSDCKKPTKGRWRGSKTTSILPVISMISLRFLSLVLLLVNCDVPHGDDLDDPHRVRVQMKEPKAKICNPG